MQTKTHFTEPGDCHPLALSTLDRAVASELSARSIFTLLAMVISVAAFTSLTKAQDARPARVAGNQIQVIDLPLNASSDEILEAKKSYKQGHIIRLVGGSPADVRKLIGSGTFDVYKPTSRGDGRQTRQPNVTSQVTAVRLGDNGDLHQFVSTISSDAKESATRNWEKSFANWRDDETGTALGDPSPPADSWTPVLSLTTVFTGSGQTGDDWGSSQTVLRAFRLNGTDTSADYYMVLTDPT